MKYIIKEIDINNIRDGIDILNSSKVFIYIYIYIYIVNTLYIYIHRLILLENELNNKVILSNNKDYIVNRNTENVKYIIKEIDINNIRDVIDILN